MNFPVLANQAIGMWVTAKKESKQLLGWHILKILDETAEVEIGYRLLQRICY